MAKSATIICGHLPAWGRAVITAMAALGVAVKSHRLKGKVVLDQLDPALQLQRWQLQCAGALFGQDDELARKARAPMRGCDRHFGDIKVIGRNGQEGTGPRRTAADPDLGAGRRMGDHICGQIPHRGGRIDPSLHPGKGGADQRQNRICLGRDRLGIVGRPDLSQWMRQAVVMWHPIQPLRPEDMRAWPECRWIVQRGGKEVNLAGRARLRIAHRRAASCTAHPLDARA
jgi:hypothetical protein